MLLHYLVKSRCSKFLPNTGFVTSRLLRFGVKVKKAYCRDNFQATARHAQVVCVSTGRHPGASARDTVAFIERQIDARNASSSRRLRPSTRDTFRAWILTVLSQSVTIFSSLCANLVVRNCVANNTFQRYVTIENICVSQGKALPWVRLGGKYLYSIQFQPLCHLSTETY